MLQPFAVRVPAPATVPAAGSSSILIPRQVLPLYLFLAAPTTGAPRQQQRQRSSVLYCKYHERTKAGGTIGST